MAEPSLTNSDLFLPSLPRPLISINQGKYLGSNLKHPDYPQSIQRWLNIPYAFPPIGNLRFRPPVPLPHVPEDANQPVTDASEWGYHCPDSMNDPANASKENESCLNLNVFRPMDYFQASGDGSKEKKELLPVIVYIHGGGFNGGNGRGPYMVSNLVAWAYTPVIGVSFNYRVGAFGFLHGSIAMAEGDNGGINAGLKDQRCALDWVQKNIEAFGGDPNKVTVVGTSAGAHSIGHHLNNLSTPPPFQRAIIESGASTGRACYPFDYKLHETQFQEFVDILGCTDIPHSELIPHLRTLPARAIQQASSTVFLKYTGQSLRWPWQPVIESGFIPRNPIDSFKEGKWHKHVGILTGFNSNDGCIFVIGQGIKTRQGFRKWWARLREDFSPADLDELESLYPDPEPDAVYDATVKEEAPQAIDMSKLPLSTETATMHPQTKRLEEAYSDYAYISPVQQTAYYAARDGTAKEGNYLYEFALKKTKDRGADHGDHAGFLLRPKEITRVSAAWNAVATTMSHTWISFVAEGNPQLGLQKAAENASLNPSTNSQAEEKTMYRWDSVGKDANGEIRLGRAIFGEGNTEGWGRGEVGRGEKGIVLRFEEEEREVNRRSFWTERVGKF